MPQLNFKKMYLISCEKYDTLKTTSAQTNNSSSSILSTSQISDNSDAQHAIDLQARASSQHTKRVANSTNEKIFSKRRKTSKLENKLVPDVARLNDMVCVLGRKFFALEAIAKIVL